MLFGLTSSKLILSKMQAYSLRVHLDNFICKYIQDVWNMWSRYADTPRDACFHYLYGSEYEETLKADVEVKAGAGNVWRNVQQLHGAMIHIFDNDTSVLQGGL